MTDTDVITRPEHIPADVWEILDGFTRRVAAVHYPYTLPEVAVPVRTLADVKRTAPTFYFDRAAVRSFGALSHGGPTGRGFFVESIRNPHDDDAVRQYRVSWISCHAHDGKGVEHTRTFDTLAEARAARDILARAYPRTA